MPSCSVIIPFHNERERILRVLNVIKRVRNLAQIICVDDCSTDGSADLVSHHFPEMTLVRMSANLGKTGAIFAGIQYARYPYILMVDADLNGLRCDEIERAVEKMTTHPEIDMIILRRVKAAINSKISRGDVLFSGERILKTVDLRQILEMPVHQYQIEIAINQYMLEQQKTVFWMPSSAVNTFKILKMGLMRGFKNELFMRRNMIAYQGVSEYIRQYVRFAWFQAP